MEKQITLNENEVKVVRDAITQRHLDLDVLIHHELRHNNSATVEGTINDIANLESVAKKLDKI
jgi:hypothetical protein